MLTSREACARSGGGATAPLFMHELLALAEPGARVLDLGCGQGSFPYTSYPQLEILALDEVLPAHPERFPHWARLLRGRAQELPLAGESCDLVLANFVLEHVPDFPRTLQEIERVLKPGGLLYCSVPNAMGFEDGLYRGVFPGDGGHVQRHTFESLLRGVYALTGLKLVAYAEWGAGFTYLGEHEALRAFVASVLDAVEQAAGIDLRRRANYIFAFRRERQRGFRQIDRVCAYCGAGDFAPTPAWQGGGWLCPACARLNVVRPPEPPAVTALAGDVDRFNARLRRLAGLPGETAAEDPPAPTRPLAHLQPPAEAPAPAPPPAVGPGRATTAAADLAPAAGRPAASAEMAAEPGAAPAGGAAGRTPVGSAEYAAHVRAEIDHYTRIYEDRAAQERLFQPVPAAWVEVERRAEALIRERTGQSATEHVVARLQQRPGVRLLSLGCGPGGLEISFGRRVREAEVVGMDINPALLELGRRRAEELGVNVTFELADLNTVELEPGAFDVVFCNAALHHAIELERLAAEIARTLRPGGELIVIDVCSRNGYLMWPETRDVVRPLFRTLPERFRVNHTAYGRPRPDAEIWEADTSQAGMECIRSQDILPVLDRAFETAQFVPYFSLCRRFLDTMYGPNYDLAAPLDAALVDWLWQLDRYYLESGVLRPETFFGIYRNRL